MVMRGENVEVTDFAAVQGLAPANLQDCGFVGRVGHGEHGVETIFDRVVGEQQNLAEAVLGNVHGLSRSRRHHGTAADSRSDSQGHEFFADIQFH
jgi:hypothetical protein